MGAFDSYMQEATQHNKEHPVEMVSVRVQESPNVNLSVLRQNIDQIDSMNDVELRGFISRSYKTILNNLFTGKDAQKYIESFQNVRFLDAFLDSISNIILDRDDIIKCNTVSYHYLTLPKQNQNPEVIVRMMRLSSIINRFNLPRLLGLGLSDNLASLLLIARYSDLDIEVCIKRVNFIIITQSVELMSEKMIEEILKILYDPMSEFLRVFQYTMTDVIPEYNENDSNTFWVTDDIVETNSTLNLSLLNILDNLPSQIIRNIILNYAEGVNLTGKKRVRFSLHNLSDDYYRIKYAVEEITNIEGINVP